MKKVIIPITVGALSVGTAATWYMLGRKKNKGASHDTLDKAVIPDQLDLYDDSHFENTKMMAEGSHYGVNYFNEQREDY